MRWAQLKSDNDLQREAISRVLVSCVDICLELENILHALGVDPALIHAPKTPPQSADMSLAETLKAIASLQHDLVARIDAIMSEPNLKPFSEPLRAVQKFHAGNIRWLAEALG